MGQVRAGRVAESGRPQGCSQGQGDAVNLDNSMVHNCKCNHCCWVINASYQLH
jgi:hypothetical protein